MWIHKKLNHHLAKALKSHNFVKVNLFAKFFNENVSITKSYSPFEYEAWPFSCPLLRDDVTEAPSKRFLASSNVSDRFLSFVAFRWEVDWLCLLESCAGLAFWLNEELFQYASSSSSFSVRQSEVLKLYLLYVMISKRIFLVPKYKLCEIFQDSIQDQKKAEFWDCEIFQDHFQDHIQDQISWNLRLKSSPRLEGLILVFSAEGITLRGFKWSS